MGTRAPRRALALVTLVAFVTPGRVLGTNIAVQIDPNADRHPVGEQIYGMNFGDAAQMARLKVPVRRWGGNSVTRYNWETDTHNSASDWFFFNYANDVPNPGELPNGSSADTFVDEIRAAGGEALITVPLIGWVGTAAAGSVRLWALDNEPMLWNSTHRDVHPAPVTYDELWTKTSMIAPAIKAQDPLARTLGPALWGWCAYFYSAADGCGPGADRAAHGGMDFIPWYLEQAKDWEAAHAVRILDYLDVHYYPQAAGVALTADESIGTSALRLRTLKSLYDPTYVDESWIGQAGQPPVQLIPRMKAWIAAFYPGTKLAITEYNWGSDDGISGALAQAEALAIFGREGVDLATRWVAPLVNSKTEDAFLLYRNYDSAGAQVAGDSVRATSADVDAVGAYAVRGGASGNTLYVLLFNKTTTTQTATVTVSGGLAQPAGLYRFSAAARLAATGTATPTAGALTLDLPARSATLAVVPRIAPAGVGRVVLPPGEPPPRARP